MNREQDLMVCVVDPTNIHPLQDFRRCSLLLLSPVLLLLLLSSVAAKGRVRPNAYPTTFVLGPEAQSRGAVTRLKKTHAHKLISTVPFVFFELMAPTSSGTGYSWNEEK